MEIRAQESRQIEGEGHSTIRKMFSGFAVVVALVVAGAGASRAQEAPEPPEPPEPPESAQVFVLNDGAGHLGVVLGDVTPEKAQELKLPAVAGAIVNSLQKDSAAAKAGIESGDAIIEFDGIRVRSSAELRRLIRETPAGRAVEMKVVRNGKTSVLSAKLEASSDHFNFNFNMPEIRIPPMNMDMPGLPAPYGGHRATLGISADSLTPQLAQYFGVKQGKGVLISEVTKGGAADKAGLKAGDVIVEVDGKPVSGTEELRDALNDNFTGDTRKVNLTLVRDHHEQTISAEVTRSHPGQKHTSSIAGPTSSVEAQAARSEALAQARELRAQAEQLRTMAASQRAMVQAEVRKQQQHLQAEWQHQVREQMLALKDQLKQMQNLRVTLHQDGEI